jgi:membrane protease YdiL (CAAX protease family)
MPTSEDGERRPGLVWRLAIVMAAAWLGWRGAKALATALYGVEYSRPRHVLLAVTVSAVAVAIVVVARRFLDRRPWRGLGLEPPTAGRRPFLLGAAVYLVPAGVATVAATGFGWIEIGRTGTPAGTLGSAAGLVVLVFCYEALPEELVFRGYLYRNLADAVPRWAGVLAQAALFTAFGALVGAATSPDRLVLFFAFGIVQGILRAAGGTVWLPIGFHTAFQTCEQLVGPMWDVVSVSDLAFLQGIVLGLVPLTAAVLIVTSAPLPGLKVVPSGKNAQNNLESGE